MEIEMSPRWRALGINLALTLITVLFLFGIVEGTLRLTGFSFHLGPEDIEFGKPDPELMRIGFEQDDELFWVTKDYGEKLEALRRERPPLIFMGDSCTHLGRYDEAFADKVAERHGRRPRFGNVGVAGWSSYQGRRQLVRDILPLSPRVVTFYYGWNDHWIGFGVEDAEVGRLKSLFRSGLSRLRVVQLTSQALLAVAARQEPWPNRVPIESFEENLRGMVVAARNAGIEPVLITAATSHRRGEEPEELGERWLRDLDELVPLHRDYVERVRAVAAAESAALCDVAARFAELPPTELEPLFLADGIHLTAEGDQRLAAELVGCFETWGLVEEILSPPR
jgi:lysophospholipase L1-like esterase